MQQHTPRFFSRSLALLWLAQLTAVIAGGVFGVAQIFWLKEQTGSPAAMGLVGALTLLPSVLARPAGGMAADRLPRRTMIAACLMLSGLVVLGLAVAAEALPGAVGALVALVGLAALAVELCDDFAGPALEAALPDLVAEDDLARANAVEEVLMGVGAIAGVVLGSLLADRLPIGPLLLGVAVAYAAAAALALGARLPAPNAPLRPVPWATVLRPGLLDDVAELGGYLRAHRGLLLFGLLMAAEASVIGVIVLHAPFFMDEVLGLDAEWYGALAAAVSAGGVAGAALAAFWSPPPGWRATLFGALLVGEGVYLALAAHLASLPLLLAISVLGGAHGGYLLIQERTLVEGAPPTELRGRVLGLLSGAHALLAAAGLAAGGFLGGLLGGVGQVYLVCGGAVALVGLAVATLPPVRAFLATAPTDDEEAPAVTRAALDAVGELRRAVGSALLARGGHAPWGPAASVGPASPPLVAGADTPDEAHLLIAAGQASAALAALERQAATRARAGDRAGAAASLREAAALAEGLQRPAEAEELYRRVLNLAPGDIDARQQLVALALRQGRPEAAMAELWLVARLSQEQRDDLGVLAALEQIVALSRAQHAAQHERARALVAAGNHREAARILRRLALLDPNPFAQPGRARPSDLRRFHASYAAEPSPPPSLPPVGKGKPAR